MYVPRNEETKESNFLPDNVCPMTVRKFEVDRSYEYVIVRI